MGIWFKITACLSPLSKCTYSYTHRQREQLHGQYCVFKNAQISMALTYSRHKIWIVPLCLTSAFITADHRSPAPLMSYSVKWENPCCGWLSEFLPGVECCFMVSLLCLFIWWAVTSEIYNPHILEGGGGWHRLLTKHKPEPSALLSCHCLHKSSGFPSGLLVSTHIPLGVAGQR